MTSELKKIDTRGEILLNDYRNGRITEAQWIVRNRKLIDRAGVLFARQEARQAGK
jgi:hypothetical protein